MVTLKACSGSSNQICCGSSRSDSSRAEMIALPSANKVSCLIKSGRRQLFLLECRRYSLFRIAAVGHRATCSAVRVAASKRLPTFWQHFCSRCPYALKELVGLQRSPGMFQAYKIRCADVDTRTLAFEIPPKRFRPHIDIFDPMLSE